MKIIKGCQQNTLKKGPENKRKGGEEKKEEKK